MRLTIIDGNNWFRRRAESSGYSNPVRDCYWEIMSTPGVVICTWDGINPRKFRREIYPDYKVHRTHAGESFYESQKLAVDVIKLSKALSIQIPNYEADDVIAALVYRYKDIYPDMFIQSNDLDLYQLGTPMARDKFPDKPHWIKLYKALVGDPSDNIKGLAGFGKKSWDSLTDENKQVLELVITNANSLSSERITELVSPFLSTRHVNSITNRDNLNTLRMYYKIIGFIPVDQQLIADNLIVGENSIDKATAIFNKYMME